MTAGRRLNLAWVTSQAVLSTAIISALALGMSVANASPQTSDECRSAPIRGHPPAEEEWKAAVGADSTELRIMTRDEHQWKLAYSPKWDTSWLLVQRRSWPPDPVRVDWSEIARVDAKRWGNHQGRGAFIGGLTAAGVATAVFVTCVNSADAAGDVGGLGCAYLGLMIGILGIPTGAIIGASLAENPRWVPIYCSEPSND